MSMLDDIYNTIAVDLASFMGLLFVVNGHVLVLARFSVGVLVV